MERPYPRRVPATNEIGDFLTSRRARIAPEDVGFGASGGRRRVAGLRRQEVALLAGISVEYYTQVERGNARGVSDDVLDAIVRALRLDDAERTHLYDLVRANASGPVRRRPAQQRVRPTIQRVLDSIATPAILRNGRMDLLAANALGRALYAPVFDSPAGPPNVVRFLFLDPRGAEFFVHRDNGVCDCVALLRAAAGRDPYDRELAQLIGELSTRSEEFRTRWAAHNVRFHRSGFKTLHHPIVGELTVDTESFELPGDPDQVMTIYTAEPASRSQEALDLLASWVSTPASAARPVPRPSGS
jgi:transcriptional regulator with XRE-family HTH domain